MALMMNRPKTVDERMKLNGGFLAGPNHRLSNQLIDQKMQQGGGQPPNLREAESPEQQCGACEHFGDGVCTKYGDAPVQETEVCDSFSPAMAEAPAGGEPAGGGMMDDLLAGL